jgi:hypothetical protein
MEKVESSSAPFYQKQTVGLPVWLFLSHQHHFLLSKTRWKVEVVPSHVG